MDEQPGLEAEIVTEESASSCHRPIILNRRFSGNRKQLETTTRSNGKWVQSEPYDPSRICSPQLGMFPQANAAYIQQHFYPIDRLNYYTVNPGSSLLGVNQLIPEHKPAILYETARAPRSTPSVATLHMSQKPCYQEELSGRGLIRASGQHSSCTRGCSLPCSCLGKRKADEALTQIPFQSVPIQDTLTADKINCFQAQSSPSSSSDPSSFVISSQVPVGSKPLLPELGNVVNKENGMNDSLTTIAWLGQMDAHKLMPCTSVRPTTLRNLERGRPPYSYMALIQFAINSSPARRMTLKQIYCWIEETFPYFKHAKPGWKNSIRHNLSLHDIFVREVSASSKSSYWTLRPDLNQRPLTLDYITRMNGSAFRPLQCSENPSKIGLNQNGFFLQDDGKPCVLMPLPSSNVLQVQRAMPKDGPAVFEQLVAKQIKQEPVELGIQRNCPQLGGIRTQPEEQCLQLSPLTDTLHFETLQPENNIIGKENENVAEGRKRRRKQPLKTLNDSLNDSLHFADNSPLTSPRSDDQGSDDKGKAPDINNNSSFANEVFSSVADDSSISESIPDACSNRNKEFVLSSENAKEGTYSRAAVSGRESPLEECLPQIFGGDAFAFNSSFNKFLNASGVSLFNLSDRSAHLSDFDDSNWASTLDSLK